MTALRRGLSPQSPPYVLERTVRSGSTRIMPMADRHLQAEMAGRIRRSWGW